MKIAVLVLANDEVCICGRCTKEGGDGGGRSYKPMIEAIRNTWASSPPPDVKVYYIYGHREGVEFPKNSKYREVDETYWPDNKRLDVTRKRYPFAIGDCIYSDTPEGRENLYYKCLDGFEWLLENEDFDYLVRPSAGSYVDLRLLKQGLDNLGIKDNIYAGSVGMYDNTHNHVRNPDQPRVIKFASGSCFIASRNLIRDLVSKRDTIDPVRSPYEEATIVDDLTFAKHFTHDMGAEVMVFQKFEMTAVSEATPAVKNYLQCYFRHTIDPELHYAVHRAKGFEPTHGASSLLKGRVKK